MLNSLCVLLMATLCLQYASGRHLVQQSEYMPYSDYSYTYAGPAPMYHQQQHSPFFSPPGTYFDHRQGILRPFPGGGVPVLVDYHKRCSNQYVGLKAHPDQHQYYYVCKPDSVIFGKCQNLQIFNATCGQCVQHPAPEYKPTCATVGRFPLFSDCHLYYKCEEDLQPKIYSCPASMIFSPISKKCINGYKCTPTQISPHSSYIPEVCASKFPPCFENGIFRSPSDCSLYYKCDLKSNGVYMQTRLRCPQGSFYDLQKHECLPSKTVPCDCIQVAELVYPKPHTMTFQPAIYPAPLELDSLEDGYYPVEQTKDESNNNSNNSDTTNDVDFPTSVTTTLAPAILETTLNNEAVEQFDGETAILSDYIDMGNEDDKSLNKELQALTPSPLSSEETAGTNDSSFESETNNTEVTGDAENAIEDATERPSFSGMETRNLEQAEIVTAFKEFEQDEETTKSSTSARRIDAEIATTSKELEQNMEATTDWTLSRRREVEITTVSNELEQAEKTTAKVSTRSIKSQPCENVAEFGASNATDTHANNTTQTQTSKCLSNTDLGTPKKDTKFSENTVGFLSTLHEHNPTIIRTVTAIPTNSLLATPKKAPVSDNLVITRIPHATSSVTEENILMSNLVDSQGSSLEDKSEIEQIIHSLEADVKKRTTTKETMISTSRPRSKETNSIAGDASFQDILDTDTIKIPKNHSTIDDQSKQLLKGRKFDDATHRSSRQLETPKTLQPKTATIKIDHATTIKMDSTTRNLIDKDVDSLNSKIKNNHLETSTETIESPIRDDELLPTNFNSTTSNPEITSTSGDFVDFSKEEFLPVHSKLIVMNDLTEENTDLEKTFDDDYTTIISEKELNTVVAPTTIRGITQQQQTVKAVKPVEKQTTLRRRQATLAATIKAPTQTTMNADVSAIVTAQPSTTVKSEEISIDRDFPEVLGTEVVIHGQSEKVSNNEVTSAETSETTSKLPKTQQDPHTTFRTFTPEQITTVTSKITTTTTETSEQKTDNLTVHIRKENHKRHSLDFPSPSPSQSLYYILETIPVITNNNNKSNNNNNGTVTAATPGSIRPDNESSIPRLEIIAERPIDVHLSICPPTCDKNHTHTEDSPVGKRAVLLKWYANKSKQTMGFETANEIKTDH